MMSRGSSEVRLMDNCMPNAMYVRFASAWGYMMIGSEERSGAVVSLVFFSNIGA